MYQDDLIREGVAMYAKEGAPNWTAVGKHAGLTGQQAFHRWSGYLDPRFADRKLGAWTDEEV